MRTGSPVALAMVPLKEIAPSPFAGRQAPFHHQVVLACGAEKEVSNDQLLPFDCPMISVHGRLDF